MKNKWVYFSALFFLMLITGVFWGTWFTLTRSIEDFSPDEFIHIGKVIIANVAVPMRFIMPAGILLVIVSLWFYSNKKSAGFYSGIVSLVFIVAVLVITLTVLVPIDNDIKEWTAATIPDDWHDIRHTWKTYHAARTLLSLLSFAFFAWHLMSDTNVSHN